MKLAAQLYTVRMFTNTDDEVCKMFERIRKAGYEAVQLSGIKAYNPQNIARALKENGLSVCSTHNSLDRIVKETDALIEEHRLFGTSYIGLGYFRGNSLEEYQNLLRDLQPALEKIAAAGMRFTYHNHAHEFIKFDGVRPIDYMKEHTDREKFFFLPDMYWVQTAGASPVRFLADFSGRTPIVHFKDMKVAQEEGKTNMAEIYEGNMDYDTIYAECLNQKVEWVVVEQDFCDRDPFESLAISYKKLTQKFRFENAQPRG